MTTGIAVLATIWIGLIIFVMFFFKGAEDAAPKKD